MPWSFFAPERMYVRCWDCKEENEIPHDMPESECEGYLCQHCEQLLFPFYESEGT